MAKMPIKANVLYFGMALLLAILTTVLLGKFIQNKNTASEGKGAFETTSVVIATRPLEAGHIIERSDLVAIDWPTEALPDINEVHTSTNGLIGRVIQSAVIQHEPILTSKLAKPNSQGGLPVLIPPGKRAVTVGVSEVTGVAGFIHPGNWVDVLGTFDQGTGDQQNQVTRTVIQHVQVLAIAQDIHPQGMDEDQSDEADASTDDSDEKETKEKSKKEKPKKSGMGRGNNNDNEATSQYAKLVTSVTLALSPDEAEKVILADEAGSIRLVLRGEDDIDPVKTSGSQLSDMVRGVRKATPVSSYRSSGNQDFGASSVRPYVYKPPGPTVEFYDGNQRSTLDF